MGALAFSRDYTYFGLIHVSRTTSAQAASTPSGPSTQVPKRLQFLPSLPSGRGGLQRGLASGVADAPPALDGFDGHCFGAENRFLTRGCMNYQIRAVMSVTRRVHPASIEYHQIAAERKEIGGLWFYGILKFCGVDKPECLLKCLLWSDDEDYFGDHPPRFLEFSWSEH